MKNLSTIWCHFALFQGISFKSDIRIHRQCQILIVYIILFKYERIQRSQKPKARRSSIFQKLVRDQICIICLRTNQESLKYHD